MKTYSDFCTTLTEQLFAIIDSQGSLLRWQKGWAEYGNQQLPMGANGLYHGANLFLLLNQQWQKGLKSNQWLTFNQVNKQGGRVKKGAKSQTVFFWKLSKIEETIDGKIEQKLIPIFKTYHVFNLEQTTLEFTEQDRLIFEEKLIDDLLARLNVTVSHFGNEAYYNAHDDVIVLPKQSCFTSAENYYATLLHELVHWTASNNRVPRQCFADYAKSLKSRAEEELIAEIGSVFLTIHFGLKAELENHAYYVQSWKTLLSAKEITSAANKAAKAFEWIISQPLSKVSEITIQQYAVNC